jgi:hypothetical protein
MFITHVTHRFLIHFILLYLYDVMPTLRHLTVTFPSIVNVVFVVKKNQSQFIVNMIQQYVLKRDL